MKHRFFRLVFLGMIFLIVMSCSSDKKVDSQAVKEEMESREIKKITEAEIISKVVEIGNSIALGAKQTLGKNLQEALKAGGVENAISFCNINAMPLVDSLSDVYGAEIKRVSQKTRNPKDQPNELEQEILEAYVFQKNDSLPLNPNVQTIDGDKYLFNKPILVDNALCLTCHGKPENGLLKDTQDFIKSKYPEDQATGYEMGDLRGMWSIIIPKKKVIQSM